MTASKVDQVRVKPGVVGLATVNDTPGWAPNSKLSIVAIAPLITACPEGNSGKFGVGTSGTHVGSGDVNGFLSVSAPWMAVIGRQKLKAYFASQQAMADEGLRAAEEGLDLAARMEERFYEGEL